MNPISNKRLSSSVAGFVLAFVAGQVALADDSEIFLGNSSTAAAPNILFVLDTSGSMGSDVKYQTPYDPSQTYTGSCSSNNIYFVANTADIPKTCVGTSSFAASYLKCVSAADGLAGPGFYSDQFVQWRLRQGNYSWSTSLGSNNRFQVACQGDFPDTPPTEGYPTTYNNSSNNPTNQWTTNANATNSYWKGGGVGGGYTLYTANYINYQESNPPQTVGTRLSVVQQAATNLVSSLSNANVGVMRYDSNAHGGMVAYAVSPIATNRTALNTTINGFTSGGNTPLSETLFEAYRYFSGGAVQFGNNSSPIKSVAASRTGGSATSNTYKSPITTQCQKNFIVYLTDGLPTSDNEADDLITGLPNEATLGGACDATNVSPYNDKDANGNAIPGGWDGTSGKCMSALAKYMYATDMNTTMQDQQNVQLYTIGFGDDPALAAGSAWLQKAATAGGGSFYTAGDLQGLQLVLTNIVNNIQKTSTTFTAPSVSVNAFNRTQTLDDLYVSVFQPGVTRHWAGNVKKYKVYGDKIVGQGYAEAVDPSTGFFKAGVQSFWSDVVDGGSVTAGGAASKIPDWNTARDPHRNLYTYIGANPNPANPVDLTSSADYEITTTNALLTNARVGASSTAQRDLVINYARGEDLKNEVSNAPGPAVVDEPRHAMGDPVHSQPAVVIYGGTASSKNVNDAVIYSATNDGFLHAFDVATGTELWSYIPQELLSNLTPVYTNGATNPKQYALDGNVKALKYDANGNGVVESGDRVLLFFGQGRGGSNYYALDVTDKAKPKFLWTIGNGTTGFSALGQAWSTPVITRVNVGTLAQNSQKLALVFAAGYDSAEEGTTYQTNNSVGNGIYIVDAVKGTLLWSAGGSSSSANLKLSRMDHSIPSDVTVIDLDGDGFADRLYVGDMAGQLWRFDISNSDTATAANLVAGGVLASLGTHDDSTHTIAATRRFYNAPDVAGIRRRGIAPFFNIAIGSGYRGHPLDNQIQDRFYSIRDYNMFTKFTQAQYDASPRTALPAIIHDNDSGLIDVTSSITTTVPANALGWKLNLNQPSNSWVGEKSLSAATTFDESVLFTTYLPNTSGSSTSCAPGAGTNRLYAVSALDGTPTANLAGNNNTTTTDRYTTLAQKTGIAPSLAFLFPDTKADGDADDDGHPDDGSETPPPPPPGGQPPVVCMSGAEVLGVCRNFNSRLKTYWSDSNAN